MRLNNLLYNDGTRYPIGSIRTFVMAPATREARVFSNVDGVWLRNDGYYLKSEFPDLYAQLGDVGAAQFVPYNPAPTTTNNTLLLKEVGDFLVSWYPAIYFNINFARKDNQQWTSSYTWGYAATYYPCDYAYHEALNRYVGVGTTGRVNWNEGFGLGYNLVTATTSTFWGVCYSADLQLLCAVGHLGVIMTSTDAITWTGRTSGTTSTFYTVMWKDNLFIAAGHLGVMRASTDGITWVNISSGTTSTIRTLTYLNDNYVIAGNNGMTRFGALGAFSAGANHGFTHTIYGLGYNPNVGEYFINGGGGQHLKCTTTLSSTAGGWRTVYGRTETSTAPGAGACLFFNGHSIASYVGAYCRPFASSTDHVTLKTPDRPNTHFYVPPLATTDFATTSLFTGHNSNPKETIFIKGRHA